MKLLVTHDLYRRLTHLCVAGREGRTKREGQQIRQQETDQLRKRSFRHVSLPRTTVSPTLCDSGDD